jgi:DNA-binding Xre family transcriptional regulator
MPKKTKSFQKYIEKRFNKQELAEIDAQAELEFRLLQSIQKMITDGLDEYMSKHKIGFNELARQLNWSPSKFAKVRRGEANLTLTSLTQLLALLRKNPEEAFKTR